MILRNDKLTGEAFQPRRSHQAFARAENRIRYHNNMANKLRKEKAFVDRPLHRNIKILIEIMGDNNEASFHKEFMKGKGFNFTVFTHYENYNGKKIQAIYQFIVFAQSDTQIKVIKHG